MLSREALRVFVEEGLPNKKKCKATYTGAEDAEMGTKKMKTCYYYYYLYYRHQFYFLGGLLLHASQYFAPTNLFL